MLRRRSGATLQNSEPPRTIRLTTESFGATPASDIAVSRAILQGVSDGAEPETLRLYTPGASVMFGPQDARSPGFDVAVAAARSKGFEPLMRLGGGRAAVFHGQTLAFAWSIPDPSPRENVDARFEEIAGIVAAALRSLGVDARVGEVPGEYCPGRHSVNARGETKLMGVSQRVVKRAAHVGGVVVVGGGQRIRDVLVPVYEALGVTWRPETAGSVQDEAPAAGYADLQEAICSEFGSRYRLETGEIGETTLALAASLEREHTV